MASFRYTDAPPAYTSTDTPPAVMALGSDEDGGPHQLQLQNVGHTSAFHVLSRGSTLYYVGHYHAQNTPDIIVYAGYDSNGPRLAQAQFIPHSNDFKVYVGDLKTPALDDWDVVRCADGGVLKNPSYRFECRREGEDARSIKSRYYWKKTTRAQLRAVKMSSHNFKLVDESNDEVVAVYVKQRLSFKQALHPKAEMVALLALLSLLEKSRRVLRSVVTVFGKPMQVVY